MTSHAYKRRRPRPHTGTRRRRGAHAYASHPLATALSVTATLAVAFASLVLPDTMGTAAASAFAMTPGSSMTLGCHGSSLALAQTSGTSVTLTCTATAAKRVGDVTSYVSPASNRASTALPAGTGVGTLLVSTLETTPSASVRFAWGWTRAYDTVNGSGVRLTTWWKVFRAGDRPPTATLSRPSKVSLLTVAFQGVNTSRPINAAASAMGLVSPVVATAAANGVALLTQGSSGLTTAKASPGAVLVRTINTGGASQVAVATTSGAISSQASRTWTLNPSAASVSGALAVMPALPVALAAGATAVAPGARWNGSCPGKSLVASRVSATTISLTCTAAPVAITTVGQTETFSSSDSDSPTTSLPSGATAGDVLVSTVETYAAAKISFGPGWNKIYDATNGSGWDGSRVAAYWKLVANGERAPSASISPGTQVAMATMAFSGVDPTTPIEAADAVAGSTSPSVTTKTLGALLVLGQGSADWQVTAKAPTGSELGNGVNNNGNAQVAVATRALDATGTTAPQTWTTDTQLLTSVA
ncbi:MAG: hypothetical protein M3P23_07095, partial [Actinomycetota bacterium]|nr:hypothetical protein [Actinomycetota bacterium]